MDKNTVLITGAAGGIGSAIADQFAAGHYQLILNTRTASDKLNQLAQDLSASYGAECITFLGDMSCEETVAELYSQIGERFGGIDILINNAGHAHIGLLQDMSLAQWSDVIQNNLTSAFLCTRYALPYMLQQKNGQIINISSVWGNVGASCEVAYSTAKGGLNTFTKALAKELAPSNIRVNALACGAIETSMNAGLEPDEKQVLCEEIPAGRFGAPAEVAEMVWQLASSPAYLTGQVITMDGGWT